MNKKLIRKMLTASGGPIYWLRKRLYNNIEPFGYNDIGSRLINAVVLNKNEHNNFKGDYSDIERAPALYLTIDNIWGEYLHIPEKERRYSNGKYKIKNNGNGTFSLPFESMEDIMQVVNSNNPLLLGLKGKLGNSVIGEYDVYRGYDKNGDYLKYIDHWRINPYDVKENKEYGLDDNSILKWYFKGKDDASFGLGTPIEIQGKYYLDDIYNVKGKDRGGHYLPEIIVTGKKKQGGKMNILEFLKNGSGIHIKKKNRGKFTSYCGGKVTDECILKGKNSSNPAIRKRATFAANVRKWKHKEGGIIKATKGTAFRLTVSNALGKVGNFINSDTGKLAINGITSMIGTAVLNRAIDKQIEANNKNKEVNKQEALLKRYLELKAEKRKKNKSYFDNNGNIINEGPITSDNEAWNEALKTTDTSEILDTYDRVNRLLGNEKYMNLLDMLGDMVDTLSSILGGKKKDSSTNNSSTNNSYLSNYVNTLYKNYGTFNSDGSMNLGRGLGTFSTTGGYKPQQYQMKTYTPLLKFSV